MESLDLAIELHQLYLLEMSQNILKEWPVNNGQQHDTTRNNQMSHSKNISSKKENTNEMDNHVQKEEVEEVYLMTKEEILQNQDLFKPDGYAAFQHYLSLKVKGKREMHIK